MELVITLTNEQRERYEQRARELGFVSLAEYVLDLLQESELDWEDFEKTGDDDEDEVDPVESLKRGLEDIRQGRVHTWDEFWSELDDE